MFVEKYFNLIFHSLLKSESHFLRNFSLFSNFQFCKSIKITIRQLYCYQERQSRAWISVGGGSLEYHQCMFFQNLKAKTFAQDFSFTVHRFVISGHFVTSWGGGVSVSSLYQWLISAISVLKEVPEFLSWTFSKYFGIEARKNTIPIYAPHHENEVHFTWNFLSQVLTFNIQDL